MGFELFHIYITTNLFVLWWDVTTEIIKTLRFMTVRYSDIIWKLYQQFLLCSENLIASYLLSSVYYARHAVKYWSEIKFILLLARWCTNNDIWQASFRMANVLFCLSFLFFNALCKTYRSNAADSYLMW